MVVVAAVLVGLRVRRWRKVARDSAVHYYSTPGPGHAGVDGQGEGRKKESAATDYYVNEDLEPGGGGEVVVNPAYGTVYKELQQSGLPYEHVYSTCKTEGALDGVEDGAGGASRPDKQPIERVPGREQHYTALNMDTVNKSEYKTLHKTP